MNITDEEAKALAAWATSLTTVWGAKFDAALAVAHRINLRLKARKSKPRTSRGKAPNPGWK